MSFIPQQFYTHSLRETPFGGHICDVLSAALNAADAGFAVKNHLKLIGADLLVNQSVFHLGEFNRKLLLGVGKASLPMLAAVCDILSDHKPSGMVITKDGYNNPSIDLDPKPIIEAGHPIPDQRNLDAGVRVSNFVSHLHADDLVIILLSGGGSSLLTQPALGIKLQDVQAATNILLKCGANITEINVLRKHMDLFKGGGLAKMLSPATVITLILSDVMGDPLDAVASGPTVADQPRIMMPGQY
jgi:hydroxypyruvate reductase